MSEHAGIPSCQGAPQPQMPLLMLPTSDGKRSIATGLEELGVTALPLSHLWLSRGTP